MNDIVEQLSADEIGQRCANILTPDVFEPVVRRAADDIYGRLLESVQDYLCVNSEYNIAARIQAAETAAATLRAELAASREREAKLVEALDDAIATIAAVRATIAAVRATASGDRDDWADSAKHFYQVCGMSMATCSAALAKHREARP